MSNTVSAIRLKAPGGELDFYYGNNPYFVADYDPPMDSTGISQVVYPNFMTENKQEWINKQNRERSYLYDIVNRQYSPQNGQLIGGDLVWAKYASSNELYDTISTQDAEALSVISYDVPQNCSAKITVEAIGRDAITGDTVGYEQKLISKRGTGSAAIVSNIITVMAEGDASLVDTFIVISVNDTALNIDVVGVDGMTIDWEVWVKIKLVS